MRDLTCHTIKPIKHTLLGWGSWLLVKATRKRNRPIAGFLAGKLKSAQSGQWTDLHFCVSHGLIKPSQTKCISCGLVDAFVVAANTKCALLLFPFFVLKHSNPCFVKKWALLLWLFSTTQQSHSDLLRNLRGKVASSLGFKLKRTELLRWVSQSVEPVVDTGTVAAQLLFECFWSWVVHGCYWFTGPRITCDHVCLSLSSSQSPAPSRSPHVQ